MRLKIRSGENIWTQFHLLYTGNWSPTSSSIVHRQTCLLFVRICIFNSNPSTGHSCGHSTGRDSDRKLFGGNGKNISRLMIIMIIVIFPSINNCLVWSECFKSSFNSVFEGSFFQTKCKNYLHQLQPTKPWFKPSVASVESQVWDNGWETGVCELGCVVGKCWLRWETERAERTGSRVTVGNAGVG